MSDDDGWVRAPVAWRTIRKHWPNVYRDWVEANGPAPTGHPGLTVPQMVAFIKRREAA